MTCETCEKKILAGEVAVQEGASDSVGNDLQLLIACPDCGQGYYTFIPLDDFVLDVSRPGKATKG